MDVYSILKSLQQEQKHATILYKATAATVAMVNSSKLTRRIHRINLRHFILLDWTKSDQIIISTISTNDNPVSGLTKALDPPNILVVSIYITSN